MANLVLFNNFMHDFSAAGWVFCTVILWILLRKKYPSTVDAQTVLADTLRTTVWLMRFSVIGIVFFGITRTLAYKTYEWNAAAGDTQVTLLIVKHIVFTAIFAVGVVFYVKAMKVIKKVLNESAE